MKTSKKITLRQFREIKALELLLKAIQNADKVRRENQIRKELEDLSGNPPSVKRKRLGSD